MNPKSVKAIDMTTLKLNVLEHIAMASEANHCPHFRPCDFLERGGDLLHAVVCHRFEFIEGSVCLFGRKSIL